jgi:conjugal transfer ATP-binding protein TraC
MHMTDKDKMLLQMFSTASADPESNIFAMETGALGFGALCQPIPGASDEIAEKLNALLCMDFPAGTLVQCVAYASPDIELQLRQYEGLRASNDNPLLAEMTRDRVNFLRQATRTPIDKASKLLLHDLKIALTVRLPEQGRRPKEKDLDRALELQSLFMATLTTIGIRHEPLTPNNYQRFMATIFNHGDDAMWRRTIQPQWDDDRFLAHQILDGDTAVDIDSHGLWFDDATRVKTLHIKRLPEFVYFGNALRYIGEINTGARGIRENVIITANLLYGDHESQHGKLEMEKIMATKQAESKLARLVPQYKQRKDSLEVTLAAVDEGDRLVKAYLGAAVITHVEPEDTPGKTRKKAERAATGAVTNAQTYFRELGYQMMQDRFFCGPLFFQLLPFVAEQSIAESLSRYRSFATRHVVPMLPILGAWRGTGTPATMLISRDGQLMTLSPYDSGSNKNALVAAQSGMGKSFLVNELVNSFLAMGARAWIIDIGNSYKKLARVMDGQYLQFDNKARLCLNPFTLVRDFEDEADVIAGLIAAMAAPNTPLNDYQLIAGVKRGLSTMWAEHGRALTMDLLAAHFKASSERRVKDIGEQLFSFTSEGIYGKYFVGENNVAFDNQLVVLELEELKARPHLQQVVLMQMMYQIQQAMYLGDRGTKKLLIIDEGWEHLAKEGTRDFLSECYRRVRKYGGSTLMATQSINDLYANDGALAIVENSASTYLLGQKKQSIEIAKQGGRLPMSEGELKQLERVHTVPGSYSEIMMLSEYGSGIGRLVVSDFNKLLYSTDPNEVAEYEQLVDQGMSTADAIRHMLRARQQTKKAA